MSRNPSPSHLDTTNIFQRAFNESDDSIRVDAEITGNISGPQEVVISSEDDSIQLGDQNGVLVSVTPVSGHNGLDVNIVGGSLTVGGTVVADQPPLNSFQTSQYSIGTSAVQLTPTPLSNRSSISLRVTCTGSNAIFIGTNSSTSISNGYPLYNGDTIQMDLSPTNTIYAVATAGGQTAYVLEIA